MRYFQTDPFKHQSIKWWGYKFGGKFVNGQSFQVTGILRKTLNSRIVDWAHERKFRSKSRKQRNYDSFWDSATFRVVGQFEGVKQYTQKSKTKRVDLKIYRLRKPIDLCRGTGKWAQSHRQHLFFFPLILFTLYLFFQIIFSSKGNKYHFGMGNMTFFSSSLLLQIKHLVWSICQ